MTPHEKGHDSPYPTPARTPATAAGRALLGKDIRTEREMAADRSGRHSPGYLKLRAGILAIEAEAAAPYRTALAALVAATEEANIQQTNEAWRKADDALAAARRLVEPHAEHDELSHLKVEGGFVAEDMGTGWSQNVPNREGS